MGKSNDGMLLVAAAGASNVSFLLTLRAEIARMGFAEGIETVCRHVS